MTEITATLPEVPDYYSTEYHYRRYPARVGSRAGTFKVWSREERTELRHSSDGDAIIVIRPNPEHVTWSPEIAVLVAKEYQTEAWHAERREQTERTQLQIGDTVRLGDVTIVVPRRCGENVTGVPCPVVDETA